MTQYENDFFWSKILGKAMALPQFFKKSDGKAVLLQGEKGIFNQPVDVSGNVVSLTHTEGTALSSAARTASTTSSVIQNPNYRAISVFLDVTAVSGTGGLIVKIRGKDPASGKSFSLNVDPPAVNATGNHIYVVGLGVTKDSANQGGTQALRQTIAAPIPKQLEIQVYHQDNSSYTYSVGYSLSV